MDTNLNVLETKVLEAVELIKELRTENEHLANRGGELENEVTTLEARLTGLEAENTRLNDELADVSRAANTVEDYEEKRKEIEDKVGGLLEKLEALG